MLGQVLGMVLRLGLVVLVLWLWLLLWLVLGLGLGLGQQLWLALGLVLGLWLWVLGRRAPRIRRPHGFKLLAFADFFFSRKTYETILCPVISDMQVEHMEALNEGRTVKARWILARGYWSFWTTVFAQLPISTAKRIYELWKALA